MDPSVMIMPNKVVAESQLEYSHATGCLMSAMSNTCPDIVYAVRRFSRYTSNPNSKKQTLITYSIMEFEFVALAVVANEAKWLSPRQLFTDLVRVGKDIGIDLESKEELVKELLGNGDGVWGGRDMDFVALDATGNTTGIPTVWNNSCFKLQSSVKQEGFVAIIGSCLKNNSKLGIINVYAPEGASGKKSL
ncbi:hypothetical protein OSB04_031729 [Centaurea solstitialis]|uniref:Uncharacterized protein n=1 Tax=Centaurea solstitialis TaxID=347529 RepID=A0AA38SN76_9ASTR|nr:hypothetical protein OSB04_031729 [Centaurea solstitialis]